MCGGLGNVPYKPSLLYRYHQTQVIDLKALINMDPERLSTLNLCTDKGFGVNSCSPRSTAQQTGRELSWRPRNSGFLGRYG